MFVTQQAGQQRVHATHTGFDTFAPQPDAQG